MKKQLGIADGWMYLIGLVVVLALIVGGIYEVKSFVDGVDAKAYARGIKETEATYAQRDNAALKAANARIAELTDAVRAAEQEGQRKLDLIAQQREKDRSNAKIQHDRDVAAARAGTLVLRDPGQSNTACTAAGDRGSRAEAGASAGNGDGRAKAGLSGEAAEFLLTLTDDADDVARQLAAAQQVIIQDRLTCNAVPAGSRK